MNVRREPHHAQRSAVPRQNAVPTEGRSCIAHHRPPTGGIGKTAPVRRTFAGFLFGLAYLCAALCLGGWFLQRTAFSPDRTADTAQAVLQDPEISTEIVDLIADNAAPRSASPPTTCAPPSPAYSTIRPRRRRCRRDGRDPPATPTPT